MHSDTLLLADNLVQLSDQLIHNTSKLQPIKYYGKLVRAAGLILEATGLNLPLGASCIVERNPTLFDSHVECEVVGFNGDRVFLMPIVAMEGVELGARIIGVFDSNNQIAVKKLPTGLGLLGRVIDASGVPLDNLGKLENTSLSMLNAIHINPLDRQSIKHVLDVGIKAINTLLTVGRGQRMGLFAGSGVGKSVLLGMMARYTKADVIVVGLIGERGREVKSFIEDILGEEGLRKAVVIAAPADVSPVLRLQGANYATRIAEDFRDQGLDVLLIMDSLTRYAMAQREIALAIGEPPATKGYPPSVFAKLPALVERAGNAKDGEGSITAFYTVLTEGDDQQDPVADSARAILDGHIVLSRTLAEAGHYPAIDIEASISRVMTDLIEDLHFKKAQRFKQLLSAFQRNRDLINVGAYAPGSDPVLDNAIKLYPQMQTFLQQAFNENADFETALDAFSRLIS